MGSIDRKTCEGNNRDRQTERAAAAAEASVSIHRVQRLSLRTCRYNHWLCAACRKIHSLYRVLYALSFLEDILGAKRASSISRTSTCTGGELLTMPILYVINASDSFTTCPVWRVVQEICGRLSHPECRTFLRSIVFTIVFPQFPPIQWAICYECTYAFSRLGSWYLLIALRKARHVIYKMTVGSGFLFGLSSRWPP